jgi:hypothetical protein
MYLFEDVPKNNNAISPGAAQAKDPNVTLIRVDDLQSEPVRNSKGVKLEGNYVFKAGKRAAKVYLTPSKMTPSTENEGDEDSISMKHMFEGMHPGDSLEINEFIQNNLGKNLILVYGNCKDNVKKVFGSKCAPLQLRPSFVADNDGTNHTLTFEQFQKTQQVPGHYEGSIPEAEPATVADENLTLSQANGYIYQLPSNAIAADIIPANTDLETGNFVTLLGGGGAAPLQLVNPATGNVVVVLKDDVAWSALDGASIDLEVVVADTTTYLIERNRS